MISSKSQANLAVWEILVYFIFISHVICYKIVFPQIILLIELQREIVIDSVPNALVHDYALHRVIAVVICNIGVI